MTENTVNEESRISIIIPVLNEADSLRKTLRALQRQRAAGHELIVVDGGSTDGSCEIAAALADQAFVSARGRALQMNAGARSASHDILLFLHADTMLPEAADILIARALQNPGRVWGRFNVRLDDPRRVFRLIEKAINLRSALSGIATGDQAIFVRRESFQRAACYPEIPLMEDVALSRALRKQSWPVCLVASVLTSARRWQEHGILQTMFLMWRLRLAYFLGVSPQRLVRHHYRGGHE